MKPFQIWLPTLCPDLEAPELLEDATRAFAAWQGERIVWLLPGEFWGSGCQSVRWEEGGDRVLAVFFHHLERIEIYHVGTNGYVCGGASFEWIIQAHIADYLLSDRHELEIAEENGKKVFVGQQYQRGRGQKRPDVRFKLGEHHKAIIIETKVTATDQAGWINGAIDQARAHGRQYEGYVVAMGYPGGKKLNGSYSFTNAQCIHYQTVADGFHLWVLRVQMP